LLNFFSDVSPEKKILILSSRVPENISASQNARICQFEIRSEVLDFNMFSKVSHYRPSHPRSNLSNAIHIDFIAVFCETIVFIFMFI